MSDKYNNLLKLSSETIKLLHYSFALLHNRKIYIINQDN